MDILDQNAVFAVWNQNVIGPNPADVDGNGFIDLVDLNAVSANWNAGVSPASGNDSLITSSGVFRGESSVRFALDQVK